MERPYSLSDILTQLRYCAAMSGGEGIVITAVDFLSHLGPSGLGVVVLPTHAPLSLQDSCLARRRFKTPHFDRNTIVRSRDQGLREKAYTRSAQNRDEVLGNCT